MKWRWMRCEISFFTENKDADLPSSLSTTVGWMPPEPETLTKSMDPPATDRNGRTPSSTSSTASSVISGASGSTWTTSEISGMASLRRLSKPIFIVIVDDGQSPQAPSSCRRTTGPSMPDTRTLPPSLIRYGRSSSKIISTLSSVSGYWSSALRMTSSSNGLRSTARRAVRRQRGALIFVDGRVYAAATAANAKQPRAWAVVLTIITVRALRHSPN
mmetsp:Transcript_2301/g.6427  ORF Transcript_2301/g.6427 Transcript_2301/m.6427 type:complete len:216 (+) Transcript_2301:63-710(+)